MLNLRAETTEEMEALAAWAESSPATSGFFSGSVAETVQEEASSEGTETDSQVRGYNEPCRDCGRPQLTIKRPDASKGQKWSPFASCGVWDDFHKAKAADRKKS
jgi:hypothetical protein